MKCRRCHHESPMGSSFCLECGARLGLTCGSCGTDLPEGSKFCNRCGTAVSSPTASESRFASPQSYTPKHLAEKILTSKGALEGERKQVTVLFADLKGSMELLADRDPEEARQILDPVLEHMMAAIHDYEGTVNQVMGDGIMALFGAPLAHEDHAVRACYAALRMQESVKRYAEGARRTHGVNVRIRVGLNSGEVVVRAIGSDLHMDYTAVGQTTHLAARMEQLADPATVLLTPATLSLAEDFVQVRPQGRTPVKGLSDALEVYELVGANPVRSRFHAHAARGLAKFVGRASEMAQLAEPLDLARGGRGQVVAVVGEPGVGKSRLFWEFAHSHRTEGCLVLEAASVSYGKATTYLPVSELLRGYFQIEPRDDVRKIREKVTGKLFSLDRALEPALEPLLALLDVPIDDDLEWTRLEPPQRRQRTLDSVKRLLLRESQVQPLVLIFEDLHWIDSETQAVLEGLVESLPTARLLLLINYRPEYQHAWGSKTYYRQLRIDALSAASAEELLTMLLGMDSSLEKLKKLLIMRTEGNPFFIEESVRTLVELKTLTGQAGGYRLTSAPESLQIPATAQAILAARIDRLEPGGKRLLQAASVVGKDVPLRLLEAIADVSDQEFRRLLARLQAAEFLYEARLFPELEYTFKHALTHEVAYGSLLQERRKVLHARIVGAIERSYPDRLSEHVERLAHHAVRGELPDKAVHYLLEAGVRAVARSALEDARAWFEQALGVLETQPQSQTTMELAFGTRLKLRSVLAQLGEMRLTLERLREAEALAERLSDDLRRGQVCAFMTNAHSLLGQLDEARMSGERALTIARGLGDLQLRTVATSYLEQVHYFRGEYGLVVDLASENLAARPTDLVDQYGKLAPPWTDDRLWLVLSLAQLGRFAEAAEQDVEAIRLAVPTQTAYSFVQAHRAAGMLRILKGDWTAARRSIEPAIAVARTASLSFFLADVVTASAWVLAFLGETHEALERVREGEQLLNGHAERGFVGRLGSWYHALGRANLQLGQFGEARRLSDRALASSPRHPGFAADALHLQGDIATHPEEFDLEGGETHYRQALALAEPRAMRPLIAHCHLGLGKLYRRIGKRGQAQEHVTAATTMYQEMGMTYWLERATLE
jgi:class 3 adenylate cyclase/tetratricopeptide (TPR) repeat protein